MERRSTGYMQVFNVKFYCQHALLERKVDVNKGGDELELHPGPTGCVVPWFPHLNFLKGFTSFFEAPILWPPDMKN